MMNDFEGVGVIVGVAVASARVTQTEIEFSNEPEVAVTVLHPLSVFENVRLTVAAPFVVVCVAESNVPIVALQYTTVPSGIGSPIILNSVAVILMTACSSPTAVTVDDGLAVKRIFCALPPPIGPLPAAEPTTGEEMSF